MGPKREYGTGGISWITPSKVRLRVYVNGQRRTKVVKVAHREHGGRGHAADELERFMAEVEADVSAQPPSRSVRKLMDAYVEDCERRGAATSTIASYRDSIKRLTPELAAMSIEDVTPHHFDTFFGALADQGYASTTIANSHAVLSASFAQAVRWTWLPANPVSASRPPAPVAARKMRLAPAEAWQLILAAQAPKESGGDADPVLAFAIFIAVVTGGRRGELCGLRWDDIDVDRQLIRLIRQWVPGVGGQHLKEMLKSRTGADDEGARIVYLGTLALEVIERFRDYMRELTSREPEGWLISYDGGVTPMRAKSLGATITKLGEKQGFGTITPHTLRRFTATELMAAGVDPAASAQRMGHTTQVMFDKYARSTHDREAAAAGALEDRLIEQGMPLGELLA